MNRFVWDYRHAPPTPLEDRSTADYRAGQLDAAVPPRAVPGQYQVRLTANGESQTQPLQILMDPRLPLSQADLEAQLELKLAIRDRLSETHAALNQITRVRRQVQEWQRRTSGTRLVDAGQQLEQELTAVERELMNMDAQKPRPGPSRLKEKLAILSSMIDESDHAPTQGARDVYGVLSAELEQHRQRLASILDQRLPEFTELLRSLEIPPIAP
jgi:hypothetical protein